MESVKIKAKYEQHQHIRGSWDNHVPAALSSSALSCPIEHEHTATLQQRLLLAPSLPKHTASLQSRFHQSIRKDSGILCPKIPQPHILLFFFIQSSWMLMFMLQIINIVTKAVLVLQHFTLSLQQLKWFCSFAAQLRRCSTLPLSFYLNLDYEVFGSKILSLHLAKLEFWVQIYFRHFLIAKTSLFSVLLFQNFQWGNIFLPAVLFIKFVTFGTFILKTLHFFQVVWDVLCLEVCHSEGQRLSLSVWLGRPSVIRLPMLPRWGTSGLAGK